MTVRNQYTTVQYERVCEKKDQKRTYLMGPVGKYTAQFIYTNTLGFSSKIRVRYTSDDKVAI